MIAVFDVDRLGYLIDDGSQKVQRGNRFGASRQDRGFVGRGRDQFVRGFVAQLRNGSLGNRRRLNRWGRQVAGRRVPVSVAVGRDHDRARDDGWNRRREQVF
jgi:hypothetical protein